MDLCYLYFIFIVCARRDVVAGAIHIHVQCLCDGCLTSYVSAEFLFVQILVDRFEVLNTETDNHLSEVCSSAVNSKCANNRFYFTFTSISGS
jgi:hypothetical protein